MVADKRERGARSDGPGRPQDPELGSRVHESVLDLLVEHGYARTTLSAVARASGVSRPTLYSRWGGRDALIVAALSALAPMLRVDDTLPPREGLFHMAVDFLVEFTSWRGGRTVLAIHALSPTIPELSEDFDRLYWAPREKTLSAAISRARESGGLEERDDEIVRDALFGPGVYRWLITGRPLDAHTAEVLIRSAEKSLFA